MEFQKQNNFEEEWRKAFENASVSPSEELWDRIELELERKKRRPLMFFLRPSVIATGIAAALILVLGGILFFNNDSTPGITQTTIKSSKAPDAPMAQADKQPNNTVEKQTEMIANDNTTTLAANSPVLTSRDNNRINKKANIVDNNIPFIAHQPALATLSGIDAKSSSRKDGNSTVTEIITLTEEKEKITPLLNPVTIENVSVASTNVESLEGKKYRYFGSRYTLNRNKLAFDPEALEVTEDKNLASNDSKFWVGVQSGVSPFNPNMKLNSLNVMALQDANMYAQSSNSLGPAAGDKEKNPILVSQPQNAIKSGVAINTGFSVGYQVSKKWHLESGVRYLRGNSTLQTNTYSFQNNGYVNTYLGDYLIQNALKNASLVSTIPSNTVVADASKFGNRYEYLMIPVQMGYEIGITKRMGLNLLAGISTDLFLQNSILTDNGLVKSKNTIDGASKIYKPLNFSGLGGVRASYLLSKHWQANIGTSYQRALFSGINSNTDLNMRLQMFGINYGVNYRF